MTTYRFDQIADNIRVPIMPKPEDSARYIGLDHLESGSLRVRRWGTEVDLIGQKLEMKEGDVLFARRNAYIRRVAVAQRMEWFCVPRLTFACTNFYQFSCKAITSCNVQSKFR
jgi:hypothetical protein